MSGELPAVVPPGVSTEERLEAAIQAAGRLEEKVTGLSREVRANRLWRWWAIVAVSATAVLIVVVVFVVSSLMNLHTIIERQHDQALVNQQILQDIATATGPQSQAASAAAIDRAVCQIRDNAAVVIHDALPRVVIALPATATCAAFTP